MSNKFNEYKELKLPEINKEILEFWDKNKTFERSISTRKGKPAFIFYEGPPSANGMPGIHHVMARTIKDVFCRYKTLKGFLVERKAGWDTHGLPVELSVEKSLGITKEDIGVNISVEEYNTTCRKEVMRYTDAWVELTKNLGYWVNMDDPYVTYDNKYIETLWHLLGKLYEKGLLYKGYSIQPYSPAAGTGLSTHELNLPGCYRDVKDTTVVAQFRIKKDKNSEFLFENVHGDLFFLAWTTTPWTLLSNTALAVGGGIKYVKLKTFNIYTGEAINVILAKERLASYFPEKNNDLKIEDYKTGDKNIPFEIIEEYSGKKFENINYEQLLPYIQPEEGEAFKVLIGDFVTTEDGTGIVHIAPSFGADDFNICKKFGIGSLTLVNKQGKFVEGTGEFSGRYVKNEYDDSIGENQPTVDIDIAVKLKKENKAFRIEKQEHSYPHCWRTDKPILYYPLDSWFIKTTECRDRMIELNNTINWQPPATGTGRFGKWLENLLDWNLSRSRYWGTPLPIWMTEDKNQVLCIDSVARLKSEIEKSVNAGFMKENPLKDFEEDNFSKENYEKFDLHRPSVDNYILCSENGQKMFREKDLIDVWFDSGAMPFAQYHYPFENKNLDKYFPSEFIAEGVDQTRGWFFTLHAISVMLFDSVSYKNIISTGLMLDKDGAKMSKRLGNTVDPFETLEKYGSDTVRWYLMTNAQPWDNLKFDIEGVDEVRRKFFGTLYNTYNFFALYANVDGFTYKEEELPLEERPEIDRWILSLLNSLIKEVDDLLKNYFPTKAGRAIQNFVTENLSNWYVRLSRRRFWGGDYGKDKLSAYQTLYTCLETIAKLASPISPFFMEKIYQDLTNVTGKKELESIHLGSFPVCKVKLIDKTLEEKMAIAQKISSMVLGLRRKVSIKVRQPLSKITLPEYSKEFMNKILAVKNIILSEVNVKEIEFLNDTKGLFVKKIKPNFKILGKKYGKLMKQIASSISQFSQDEISEIETNGNYLIEIESQKINILIEEVEIISEDIPGWLVANDGMLTIALDIKVTEQLREEGLAREFINRIQNMRKDSGFEVTDKINIEILQHNAINNAINNNMEYIAVQTLANTIMLVEKLDKKNSKAIEIDSEINTFIRICKNL
ncbi:isoleucine--tRNA ligase [Bacteroidota bacterium]